MPRSKADDAGALPLADAHPCSGVGRRGDAECASEGAQLSIVVPESGQTDQQQPAAHAAHHALPHAGHGADADGLQDDSSHSKPHVPQSVRGHRHARSMSGLSAGSIPSINFEETGVSSGFGDHVRPSCPAACPEWMSKRCMLLTCWSFATSSFQEASCSGLIRTLDCH